MNNSNKLKNILVKEFRERLYWDDRKHNNKHIADVVFSKKEKLEKLNSIVHPFIIDIFNSWAKKQNAKYVILEGAVIFESGIDKKLDYVITVYAPTETRIEIVMKRDKVERKTVLKRIQNQLSDEEKIKLSGFIIYNDVKQMILNQVIELNILFISKVV